MALSIPCGTKREIVMNIIYFCTILHEVNLTFNHPTKEQDNFHEVPVKLAGQLGVS